MSTCVTASGTADRTLELVYKGYSLADYRAAAADPNYRIVPPVWSDLTSNHEHLPPLDVKNPAGRPKQGAHKKARVEPDDKQGIASSVRIESDDKQNASSSTCAVDNEGVRPACGVGITVDITRPAAGGAGGDASGGAAGVMGHLPQAKMSDDGHTSKPAVSDAGTSQDLLPVT